MIMLRVANGYSEMTARAEREREAARVRHQAQAEGKARTQRDAARRQAVQVLVRLAKLHPSFGALDQVYYFLAIELAAMGSAQTSRRTLEKLIDSYPDSPLAEHAREALSQ